MQINIDRLHSVLEGKLLGRGNGRTIAGLVQLAQYVDFHPHGKLVHFSANFTQARANREVFHTEILDSLGMKDEVAKQYSDYTVFDNGCKVYFMSLGEGISNVENRLRGIRIDNFVIDHFAEYLYPLQLNPLLQRG